MQKLYQSYPLAKAYPTAMQRERDLLDAKFCFRDAAARLRQVHSNVRKRLDGEQSRINSLVTAIEKLRESNEGKVVALQSRTNAAEGAEGMYNDVVFFYNLRLVQALILVIGAGGMGWVVYNESKG